MKAKNFSERCLQLNDKITRPKKIKILLLPIKGFSVLLSNTERNSTVFGVPISSSTPVVFDEFFPTRITPKKFCDSRLSRRK